MTITALRILTVASAVALAGLSATEYRRWKLASELALAELDEARLQADAPLLARDVARERDRIRVRLRIARALLAEKLDARRPAANSPEDRESIRSRSFERLNTASKLAGCVLETRHSSWQAAMILGAAEHLQLLRSRDARLAMQEDSWLLPLALSRRLAPNHSEPTRFLAAAQLGSWTRLSSARRRQTVEILVSAFEDRETFEMLIEPWLVVAPSFQEAFEIIPDRPGHWDRVRTFYARRRDWERYVTAHRSYSAALIADLEQRLVEAKSSLEQRNERRSVGQLKNVDRNLPVELGSLDLLDQLLDLIQRTPPQMRPRGDSSSKWLDWYVDQCLLAACPEPGTILPRLITVSKALQPHQTAVATLLMGNGEAAALYESRFEASTGAEWAPYQILRARRLADDGNLTAAGARLDAVHSSWQESPFYALARFPTTRMPELSGGTRWQISNDRYDPPQSGGAPPLHGSSSS
jgi:hypothetical protein